jgi:hypothetical protein
VSREERLERAVTAGIAMRRAQDIYFRTRTREALIVAKDLEREFDRLAEDALNGHEQAQAQLL